MIIVLTILLSCFILAAHFVADFVFQNDTMAINKSSSNKWLFVHTGTYSAVMLVLLLTLSIAVGIVGFPYILALGCVKYVAFNFIAHTATDYITSRLTTKLWKEGKRHEFFVVIGIDQLLHSCALLLSIPLLLMK